MAKSVYLAFVDTETSGLYTHRHGIHELSMILDQDGLTIETSELLIAIEPHHEVSPEALELKNLQEEDIRGLGATPRLSYRSAHKEFTSILKTYINPFDKKAKAFLVAYNSPFDEEHLRKFFLSNGDRYYGSLFWAPSICVAKLAAFVLQKERHYLPDFKLGTICNYCGLDFDPDEAHSAMYDVVKTRELYYHLCGRLGMEKEA